MTKGSNALRELTARLREDSTSNSGSNSSFHIKDSEESYESLGEPSLQKVCDDVFAFRPFQLHVSFIIQDREAPTRMYLSLQGNPDGRSLISGFPRVLLEDDGQLSLDSRCKHHHPIIDYWFNLCV